MKILIVGLTGGIVAGKTTVAELLKELGAEIIDADEIAHETMRPGEKTWEKIILNFGKEILGDNQEIHRKKLAQIVFSDKEKLDLLNKITHPEIILKIKDRIRKIKVYSTKDVICVVDVPLLFETKMEKWMDKTIVVYLSREEQIKRLFNRDGLSRNEAIKRIDSQIPMEKKVLLADYVIDNHLSIEKTKIQVFKVWENLENYLHKPSSKNKGTLF